MIAPRNLRVRSPGKYRGATLIELLAVILILLMITAATIPAVAPAMAGRRIREGARMLSTFLNAARSRAIETGRPAGVWFERTPGMVDVAENLYLAEIPPPYSGDFLDSRVECSVVDEQGHLWRGGDDLERNMQDYWNIVVPRSRTTFLTDAWSNPDPTSQQLVRAGDLIQLEGHDRLYPLNIVDIPLPQGDKWWYILRGRNCETDVAPNGPYGLKRNPDKRPNNELVHYNGRWVINWFERALHVGWHHVVRTVHYEPKVRLHPIAVERAGIGYKIYRQPIKLMAGSMQMPDTVVVDLNYSSMTVGLDQSSGIPFHPREDPADSKTATKLRNPYWGDSVIPNDSTPVVIVFSAGGQVERVYCHQRDKVGNWSWQPTEAFGPIYFLIGDRQHMTPETYRISQTAQQNLDIQFKKNWLSFESLWVRIAPNTGNITVSLVDNFAYLSTDSAHAGQVFGGAPQDVWRTRVKAQNDRLHGGR